MVPVRRGGEGYRSRYDDAREIAHEPYAEWKAKYQAEASAEQKAAFEAANPKH